MNSLKCREQYKKLISTKFNELISLDLNQSVIKKISPNHQYLIATKQHHEAILNLLTDEYSKWDPICLVFDFSNEKYGMLFEEIIKSKIDAGRFVIVMNKINKELIACLCCGDYYDVFDSSNHKQKQIKLSRTEQHIFEIISCTEQPNKLDKYAGNKYGKLCHFSHYARKSESHSLVAPFLLMLGIWTMFNCNYKNCYAETVSPSVFKFGLLMELKMLYKLNWT
eukprot:287090_1